MPNHLHHPKRVTRADQEIGRQVHALRIASGIAIADAAAALGISWQQLCKYERGASRISAGRLQAIANLFGVPISAFVKEDAARVTGCLASELVETPGASELLQLYLSVPDEASRRSILTFVVAAADLKA